MTHSIDEAIVLADRILVMSARPGRIKDIIDVGAVFGRPRQVDSVKSSPHYGELFGRVWGLLRDEVAAARAEEDGPAEWHGHAHERRPVEPVLPGANPMPPDRRAPWYRTPRHFERTSERACRRSSSSRLGSWARASAAIDVRFFPAPSRIFETLLAMLKPTADYPRGELLTHFGISLSASSSASCWARCPGMAIGLAMGLFSWVRAIIQPLVDGTYPDSQDRHPAAVHHDARHRRGIEVRDHRVAVIYQVLINTVAGVRNIDRIYLDVGTELPRQPHG